MTTSIISQPSYGGLFVTEIEELTLGEISANSSKSANKSISKAGYYPIGVTGWDLNTTSGYSSAQTPFEWRVTNIALGSGTLRGGLANHSGTAYNGTLKLYVLWQKA